MLNYIKKRFALSTVGAKDLLKAVLFSTLLNISLMLPSIFIFLFIKDAINSLNINTSSLSHNLGFYVLMALAFMTAIYTIARIQYRSTYTKVYNESANRRISIAEKLRRLPLSFFGEKNLSDLTATIMDDNTQLEQTFSHAVPQLIASITSVLLISLGLFFYNWQLSLALFWVVPLATLVVIISKGILKKKHQSFYNIKREVSEQIQEGIESIQEIKAYNQEKAYLKSFDSQLKRFEQTLVQGELMVGTSLNISYLLLKLGLATVIIVGAILLSSGNISLLMYLTFLMVSTSIYNPIIDVFNNMAVLSYLDIRINRMREIDNLSIQTGKTKFAPDHYDIEFRGVDFSYESDKSVLNNVSFCAKQGEITALVGPSGGGKSTVAKLATRFWDINRGQILLGNQDISQVEPETLLKNYSVVFQDVVLFNTSIIDNIRIGRQDASDEEVRQVANKAQCDEFVSKMPQGYQTIIGENGDTLSGGERQRISIARALLKDAPIVVLDEATASLDVENESKIQAAISAFIKNKTVLIIAHRMRTIANADKVIVLENGEVVENGAPGELKKKGGLFAKMVARQSTNQHFINKAIQLT